MANASKWHQIDARHFHPETGRLSCCHFKRKPYSPRQNSQIPGHPPRSQTDLENSHFHQKEATRVTLRTHVLDPGQEIGAHADEQTTTLQDHHQAHMDVRHNTVGHSLPLKHRNPPKIPKQSPQDVRKCPLVHTKQPPTHRSTDGNRSGRNKEPQLNL